ncbi:hypothetical protein V8D89_005155 [Ganoderma adspersum]
MDPRDRADDLDFLLNSVVRATTNLRDENARLKAENERLERVLSETLPEVKLLREERLTLKGAVRVLVLQSGILPPPRDRKPITFLTFPHEVLELIFSFAAAERTHQFDPSIVPAGAHNPWLQLLRTKKGFPLICRATFWPGMAALYTDIVLRRMGQVSGLAERLRAPDVGPRLRTLIKSIRWDSCIVAASCSDVIREDMSFILGQCTQLHSFSYHPHRQFPLRLETPDRDECEGCFNPLWFISPSDPLLLHSSAVSNLRSLDLSVDLQKVGIGNHDDPDAILVAIHRVLSASKGLQSLTLGPWPSNSSSSLPEALTTMPSISFPSLTHLQIFTPEGALDTYLRSHWTAPRLTHLTILISTAWSPLGLLERLGRRLRYLHLYPVHFAIPDVSAYLSTLASTLSSVCPALEHLVAPRWSFLLVDSPTLAHLDFWGTGWSLRERQDRAHADANRAWTVDARSSAPALRTVRCIFVDARLVTLTLTSAAMDPDWPWVCHPRLLAQQEDEDGVLFHQFPLGRVAQTVAAIIPESLWQMLVGESEGGASERDEGERESGGEESEEAEDEEFEESGGEETSSSGWTSESSDGSAEEEGDLQLSEHGAMIEENVEPADGRLALEDGGQTVHTDSPGEREQVGSQEGEEIRREEADGRLDARQLEAATELATVVEYPVAQLDRATILAAFQRGTRGEDYNDVNLLDRY